MATCLGTISDGHSPDWLKLQRSIFREMEKWLDRSRWAPHLAHRQVAEMIVEAVEHRNATRDWRMLQYVVMPTHLHLFCEIGERGLRRTMAEFKRWTGHEATKLVTGFDASRFWQREWFDHWSRSEEEDDRIARYIQNNPVKAGLVNCWEDWPYRSK
jgi:putative transposase